MKKLASLAIAAVAVVLLAILFSAPVLTLGAAQAAEPPPDGQEISLSQKAE
jgi:hypothetical protein